jgi:hypothetical protein
MCHRSQPCQNTRAIGHRLLLPRLVLGLGQKQTMKMQLSSNILLRRGPGLQEATRAPPLQAKHILLHMAVMLVASHVMVQTLGGSNKCRRQLPQSQRLQTTHETCSRVGLHSSRRTKSITNSVTTVLFSGIFFVMGRGKFFFWHSRLWTCSCVLLCSECNYIQTHNAGNLCRQAGILFFFSYTYICTYFCAHVCATNDVWNASSGHVGLSCSAVIGFANAVIGSDCHQPVTT